MCCIQAITYHQRSRASRRVAAPWRALTDSKWRWAVTTWAPSGSAASITRPCSTYRWPPTSTSTFTVSSVSHHLSVGRSLSTAVRQPAAHIRLPKPVLAVALVSAVWTDCQLGSATELDCKKKKYVAETHFNGSAIELGSATEFDCKKKSYWNPFRPLKMSFAIELGSTTELDWKKKRLPKPISTPKNGFCNRIGFCNLTKMTPASILHS